MAKQIETYVEENLTDGAQQTALEFINYFTRILLWKKI